MITKSKDFKMENIVRKIGAATITSAILTLPALSDEMRTFEKTFTVDNGASFSIDNINGQIEVKPTTGDAIKVVAEITADTLSDLERVEVIAEQSGNKVKVKSEYEDSSYRNQKGSASVQYTVYLPEFVNDTDIDLVNGSLDIVGVSGKLEAELVNGSIKAENVTGDSQLKSVNGSIKVSFDSLEQVDEIDVDTVNGSIRLYLPANASLDVDAETMHGSIKNDFGIAVDKNFFAGKNMQGSVAGGDIKVSLESVNGSIKLLAK